MAQHNETGKEGEKVAVDYLIAKGYEIVQTNYQARKAEIDIIARKGDWLIVVEVKTRSSADYGNPEDFVNKKKIKLLVNAIDEYIVETNMDLDIRFDIISVIKNGQEYTVEHLEDAFYHF